LPRVDQAPAEEDTPGGKEGRRIAPSIAAAFVKLRVIESPDRRGVVRGRCWFAG